eukprot:TRINITY_DN11358_c3_g1_i2.p1 TRINITY_DN11358_c3_g1~~TRINITY_DN11358_c3_g1_i2.p1  ORF type:complete len:556 (+),score=165.78 TRINITY_DN11358_c3_g1_i2:104-1669(+)
MLGGAEAGALRALGPEGAATGAELAAAGAALGVGERVAGRPVAVAGTVTHRRQKSARLCFMRLGISSGEAQGSAHAHVDSVQLVLSDTGDGSSGRFAALAALLRPGAAAAARGDLSRDRPGDLSVNVGPQQCQLIAAPPEPACVQRLLEAHSCGAVDVEEARRALRCSADQLSGLLSAHAAAQGAAAGADSARQLKQELKLAARRLRGLEGGRPPRDRQPTALRLRPDLAVLEEMERGAAAAGALLSVEGPEALSGEDSDGGSDGGADEHSAMLAGLPPAAVGAVSRGLSRADYAKSKKAPQVRWMQRAVSAAAAAARRPPCGRPLRILDIGGGRGDLALAVARALPAAEVVVVDTNAASLGAGEQRAAADAVPNLRFLCADATTVAGLQCEVVMALHACGGLTDLALRVAAAHGAAFVIAPCCFMKHAELSAGPGCWHAPGAQRDAVCRLAECRRRELSERAMRLINSLRLAAWHQWPGARPADMRIRSFPPRFSLRNQVLYGVLSAAPAAGLQPAQPTG